MTTEAATSASATAPEAPSASAAETTTTSAKPDTPPTPQTSGGSQQQQLQQGATFRVLVTGEIVGCEYPAGVTALLAKYEFVHGTDWAVVGGTEHGITQTSSPSQGNISSFVWNHPLDVSFSSRNPHGWPQISVAVFGPDALGRDVVRGYGAEHVPAFTGRHERWLPLWVPQASSALEGAASVVLGKRTEYVDPKFAARGPGREVTKVRSFGRVKLLLDVVVTGMSSFGFST